VKNACFPEFVHSHVLTGLFEATGSKEADSKHFICFKFHPFKYIQEHGIHIKASNVRIVLKSFEAGGDKAAINLH